MTSPRFLNRSGLPPVGPRARIDGARVPPDRRVLPPGSVVSRARPAVLPRRPAAWPWRSAPASPPRAAGSRVRAATALGPAVLLLLGAVLSVAPTGRADAAERAPGARLELRHAATGHHAHLSGPALARGADGAALVAWAAAEGAGNNLYVARFADGEPAVVRVNPPELSVDALHHPPRIVAAPTGEVYVSWSSAKPVPEGALFASDLRLSRSTDGGRSFTGHLRINDDRAISHSFDGLAVAPDGTVLVSWLDSRAGGPNAGAFLARIGDRGSRIDGTSRVGEDVCVCCRVDLAAGPGDAVAVVWRKVFPGDIRDMVVSASRDGGRSFAPPALVSADRWRIAACPHRGGAVGVDARGRLYASWYTEGAGGRPDLLFAVSEDGRRFGPHRRLNTSTASIPDHARMAVARDGRAAIAWEDSTAVRRRILLRSTADGRALGPIHTLSAAIKAWQPDIVSAGDGRFLVAWHEEQFPHVKTVVHAIEVARARSR
jgi:hypothetical protein